mgnify:FL=1
MDVIIFSGQSNMQGQTESLPYTSCVRGAYEYKFLQNAVVPLRHPVGEDIGDGLLLAAYEGHGSLVPAFCRAYVRETGRKVLAVHAAKGATTVAEWLPEHPSGRYNAFLRKVQGAFHAAGKKDRVAVVWLQGESDALESVSQQVYEERLQALRARLAQDVGQDVFAIIRVGKFARDERDIPVIKAQEHLCAAGDFVMLTRVTGQYTEQPEKYINPFAAGHYNNRAMEKIGSAAGANLARFYAGQTPVLEKEPYPELR